MLVRLPLLLAKALVAIEEHFHFTFAHLCGGDIRMRCLSYALGDKLFRVTRFDSSQVNAEGRFHLIFCCASVFVQKHFVESGGHTWPLRLLSCAAL